MSRSASPLRYPGGKACLHSLAVEIIDANDLNQRHYAEPYSGGCGLALSLLYDGHVSQIHINDVDRSVWAFWYLALNHTDDLIGRINDCSIDVDEWHIQRAIQKSKETADISDLGFSTFFLNRTNRSGIIHSGGIIGGKAQKGEWKIDCRFNKADLCKRISRLGKYSNRIHLYQEDAEAFMGRVGTDIPSGSLFYIDPPYYEKGSLLYRNSYRAHDHERIGKFIASELTAPWFMTYDNVAAIRNIYRDFKSVELDIGYSVQTKRRGSEILIASPNLQLPFVETAMAH